MTPTLNVNLKPCTCPVRLCLTGRDDTHWPDCPGAPVLIPCPLPSRVEFTVRLGPPCTAPPQYHHHRLCNRPIRVTCTIGGETWDGSEVSGMDFPDLPLGPSDFDAAWAACCECWALAKALVTGGGPTGRITGEQWLPLKRQRDAVFAALADMARAEEQAWQSAKRLLGAIPRIVVSDAMKVPKPSDPECTTISESWLAAYVERLVEQVGVLP